MRSLAGIALLVFGVMMSSAGLAHETLLSPSRPNVLMTPTEISQLPEIDRKRYLGEIRNVLNKAPEDILLAQNNECGESQKQCEPSLFGEHVCLPKHADATSECGKASKKDRVFIATFWDGYMRRVQNYCVEQKMPQLCRELGERRVELFMSRRTH